MSPDEERRPAASDIFEDVLASAHEELERSNSALAFSGVAAGLGIGLTGLSAAATLAVLGDGPGATFLAAVVSPIGFIVVIVGRQQLFTENTLYPVALALDERGHWLATLRLWGVVFVANVVGALAFAVLAVQSGGLEEEVVAELVRFGVEQEGGPMMNTFWSAVIAGWLIALVAWLVTAARATIGQVAVIWTLTFLVGLARLDHSIATAAEILAAALDGAIGVWDFVEWLLVVTAGNIAGGVSIVTVLNYGQVVAGDNN